MQEMVARLQVVAITTTLLTRLKRSAISATGRTPTPTTIEMMETRLPSALSLKCHSALMYGNSETITCRSM